MWCSLYIKNETNREEGTNERKYSRIIKSNKPQKYTTNENRTQQTGKEMKVKQTNKFVWHTGTENDKLRDVHIHSKA